MKQASFINNFTGLMMKHHGDALGGGPEAIRYYEAADASFQRCIGSSATNVQAMEAWADVSYKLGQLWAQMGNASQARWQFDRMSSAWRGAIQLQSPHGNSAWDAASHLKQVADDSKDGVSKRLHLYGALILYFSLRENECLSQSTNFLYEFGDCCRSAAVYDTGANKTTSELIETAASVWNQVFDIDLEKRFHLWDLVVHADDPAQTQTDRLFLGSLVLLAEKSEHFLDDLMQCYNGIRHCNFEGVVELEDDALINLVAEDGFNVATLNLSHCHKISGQVIVNLSRSCEFLQELRLVGLGPDFNDQYVALICKRFKALELVDLSECKGVTNSSLASLAKLNLLRTLHLRSCDLSDSALLEQLLCAGYENQFKNLDQLNVSQIPRVSFGGSIFQLLEAKRPREILHSTLPCSMLSTSDVIQISDPIMVKWIRQEAHMAHSNAVIPLALLGKFYFEVEVISAGQDNAVGIGIAPAGHLLIGMPGWSMGSFGYHGDDGAIFSGDMRGQGRNWGGPCFGAGDCVGMGLVIRDKKLYIYFSKNGLPLGIAWTLASVPSESFFCVAGALSLDAQVRMIFDPARFRLQATEMQKFLDSHFDGE